MDEITQRKCHYKQYMDPEQRYVRDMEQLMTNDKSETFQPIQGDI